MKKSNLMVTTAGILAAVSASIAPAALALPPQGDDPVIVCPRGYVLQDGVCVKLPPPPPVNNPVVTLDVARQTTDQSAIRVSGSATDADASQTALTVRISVDGVLVKSVVADRPDPPVAYPGLFVTVPPVGGTGHRYDVTVPAGANAQQVCVTAVNVGSGSNTTTCKAVDNVLEFSGNTIAYDVAHAQITASNLETLDKVTNINATNVQQSTEISGEKTVSETFGWKATAGIKISLKTKAGIPLIGESEISVEGSFSYEQNSSTTNGRKFAWKQPVIVPAKSKVVATVAVTKTTLDVPYTLSGDYIYESGARVAGSIGGTFSGVNGHDLEVRLAQFDLDGMPAAVPVPQPQASLLQEG